MGQPTNGLNRNLRETNGKSLQHSAVDIPRFSGCFADGIHPAEPDSVAAKEVRDLEPDPVLVGAD